MYPLDFSTVSEQESNKVEKIIIDELEKARPNFSFISEERGFKKNKALDYQ